MKKSIKSFLILVDFDREKLGKNMAKIAKTSKAFQ
jgi:hypothetical protein